MTNQPLLAVKIDRDSVCAGDDTDPHATIVTLSPSATFAELLRMVTDRHFLASISGDKATWLVAVPAFRAGFIGVVAQQWDAPRLLIPAETTVASLFAAGEPAVYFTYWLQSDPHEVFACLQAGLALPERF